MDKPLSQERLSEADIQSIIDKNSYKGGYTDDFRKITRPEILTLLSEIKRLQAIEAERDRYQAVLEDIETHIADFKVIGYEHFHNAYIEVKQIAHKALKGADTNE